MNKILGIALILLPAPLFCMNRSYVLEQHEIVPLPQIQFDDEGHFKEDKDLALFLVQAIQAGAIPKDFDGIKRIKRLSKELLEARYASEQLWLVDCMNDTSFILKEIKEEKEPLEEIKRLEQARTDSRLQPYVGPCSQENLQLIFPASCISYTQCQRKHIMTLLPKAQGLLLQSLMEDFEKSPNDPQVCKCACKAYYDLGAAMAKFYKNFGTLDATISHKDLHQGNIFYDESDGLISLIDNERIVQTLECTEDISCDLGFLFVTSPFILAWTYGDFLQRFPAKKWYEIVLPSFVIGFMRTYENRERAEVFSKLSTLLCRFNTTVNAGDSTSIRSIIEEILKDMYLRFQEGKAAVHIAASNPDLTALVKILIQEKTRGLGKKDSAGNTPLHEAAYFGCTDSVALLIAAGCDVWACNDNQETPLFKAEFANHREIVKLIKRSATQTSSSENQQ